MLEDIGSLLNTALAHDQFARLLLEAGGLPHLYVQTADPDPTPEFEARIKAATDGSIGGRNRSTPIVDANTSINAINVKPVDMEFLDLRNYIDLAVCRCFGILPHLVGVKMESGKTYSNVSLESRHLVDFGLQSWFNLIAGQFSRYPWLPDGQVVEFDTSELLMPLPETQVTMVATLYDKGLVTLNEARDKLGLPEADPSELECKNDPANKQVPPGMEGGDSGESQAKSNRGKPPEEEDE